MVGNPFRQQIAQVGTNRYAAGNKVYGGGRPNPTSGPVDPMGYAERDRATQVQRQAMLNRLKAQQGGRFMSSAFLGR